MSGSWGSLDAGDLWESKVSLGELSDVVSPDIGVGNDGSLDNVDGFKSSAVSSGHLTVELGHGIAERVGSVFLVHVDHTSSGFVLEHEAVVLD